MNKYSVDIKVIGYINVHIEAESEEEALEKASDIFESRYMGEPIKNLSYKSTESSIVSED